MTTDNRKVEYDVTVADNTQSGRDSIARGIDSMTAKVSQAADKASKSVGGIGDGGEGAAQKLDKSTRSIINSVQRATAALEAGGNSSSKYFESIASQRNVNTDALRPYIDQLRQAERAQQVATGGLDKMGMSAKATNAALRQVPAQFTDIITSLQGGQAPLTVLLQQGGQLKDVFGGVGAAASALGNYVLGLVNPFTLAAAAVAALTVAYNLGSKESDAYNRALILTGNAAGTTSGQLQVYAQQISAVVGTQGKAAETLAAFAASGKVGAENLRQFSQTAIEFERATGTAVDETIKKFVELRNAPLQASLKLNETTNYLTESLYKQIKALEAQGKTTEAANLAQNAFADSLNGRGAEIQKNLGSIERGWIAIKDAIKGAADAALSVGRTTSPEASLAALRQQLARGEASLANGGPRIPSSIGATSEQNSARQRAAIETANAGIRSQIAELEKQTTATQVLADAERKRAESFNAFVAADKEKDKNSKSATAAENKDLEDQNRIYAELAGVSSGYYKELATAQQQRAKGLITEQQYVAYVEALITKQPFYVEQIKAEADAVKELRKARQDEANELDKALEARAKAADTVGLQVQRLRDEEQAAGIAAAENISLAKAIEQVGLARLREERARQQSEGADEGTLLYLQKEIDYREQIIDLIGNKDAREAGVKAAKDAEEAWKRTAESIESSLTDALLRGFESGKGFLRNLIDTTKNLFATLVLRPQIQAVFGLGGSAGAAQASGGSGGGGFDPTSITSLFGGNSIGAGIGSGLVSIGNGLVGLGFDNVGAGISGLADGAAGFGNLAYGGAGLAGGLIGKALFGGKGQSSLGGSLGGIGGLALSGSIGTSLGIGAAAAGTAAGASAGATAGSVVPVVGTVIGAVVGALLGSLIGSSRPYNSGGAFQAQADGPGFRPTDRTTLKASISTLGRAGFEDFSKRGSPALDEATKTLATGLQTTLVDILGTFDKTASDVFVAFRANGKKATGNVNIGGVQTVLQTGTNDPQKAFTEFADFASRSTLQALDRANLPQFAKDLLAEVSKTPGLEALQTVAQTIQQIVQVTKSLQSLPLTNLKTISEESVIALAKLTGGLSNLNDGLSAYYAAFYTDAERTAEARTQLTKSLAALGVTIPASRDQFRALVNAQDLSTEAGRKMYAELLKLAPAFASVTQATAAATQAAQDRLAQVAAQNASIAAAYREQGAATAAYRDSIKGLTDDLFSEAQRIRGLLTGAAGQSFAQVQGQFAVATAQARAGDTNAAKLLPGLSQQLLDLAEKSASTSQELAVIRAQTAASLDTTGTALNRQNGITYRPPASLFQSAQPVNARSTTDDVVAALKALQDELAAMRTASDRTADSSQKTARVLIRVTRDGDGMVVSP